MANREKLVLFVTDLHAGSTKALLPPNFQVRAGHRIQQSPEQQWLWKCWQDFTHKFVPAVVGSDDFILVTGSDAIDGDHHRTTEIISRDNGDHLEAASQLLSPLAKQASRTFCIEGTECHTGTAEHSLGSILNAEKHPNGNRAWPRLDLSVHGTPCAFRHHIGTSVRMGLYATQLGVALAEEQVQAARVGHTIPKVVVAGHRHTYGMYEDAEAMCVTGPSWQALTRYGNMVVPEARIRVGALFLDWRGLPKGSLPRVLPRLYTLPEQHNAA